jgi:hypothetical protein
VGIVIFCQPVVTIAGFVLALIPAIGPFLSFLVAVVSVFVFIGIEAHIYSTLCGAVSSAA